MIQANLSRAVKVRENFWNNFHFHPTDAIEDDWGRAILDTARADGAAGTVRMYAMLEDIVSMDADGTLRCDFSDLDKRLDYMTGKGYGILLSFNFIPPCIADPEALPAELERPAGRYKNKRIISAKPRDYKLWEEICYETASHLVSRYGVETVSKWYLQCFNEPDVRGFFMRSLGVGDESETIRSHEYCKLYEAFQNAILRVDSRLKIGGPTAAHFIIVDIFLKYASEHHLKLDFLSAHSYGTDPEHLNNGTKPFDYNENLNIIRNYIEIAKKYCDVLPEIVIDEWGASGAGYSAKRDCPALMMRETEKFPAFFAGMVSEIIDTDLPLSKLMICLSGQHQATEDFTGYRSFFTLHMIRKPIYNGYVMLSKLGNRIFDASSDTENLRVLATGDENGRAALLFTRASKHFDEELGELRETVRVTGSHGRRKVTLWCIDETHTNPYRLWQKLGWGSEMTGEQLDVLRAESVLKPLTSFEADGESFSFALDIRGHGVMLAEIEAL